MQETTNLLGSLASEGVVPQILLDIENVQVDGGVIVVATIKQGKNKPYRDIKFVNDETLNEFVVTVERKNVEDNVEVGEKDDRDKILSNSVLDNPTSTLSDRDDRDKNVEDNVEVGHQQRRIPYKLLSGTQKDIIQFCSIARTYKEILTHIGYKYNSKYMASLIKPLIDMGYLELTIPDKPNSKNQKYRKVDSNPL